MRHATIRLLLLCFALTFAGCDPNDATRSNHFLELTSLKIGSEYAGIANLTDNQFTAIGDYAGELSKNITTEVTWRSSDLNILSINSAGLATAVSPGTVTVSAVSGEVANSIPFTVSSAGIASLAIAPTTQRAPVGLKSSFTVSGTFNDGSSQTLTRIAEWTSLDPAIASISNAADSKGVATGLSVGTASIQAEWQEVSDVATLSVTDAELTELTIDPADAEYPAGLTIPYSLSGTYSDGSSANLTDQAYWTSDDETNATVDNTAGEKGKVKTLASGLTDIIAVYTDALTGEWEASTGLEVNYATLREILLFATVYDAGGGIVSEDIEIDAAGTLDVSSDQTVHLTAIGEYSDNEEYDITTQVTWASSDTAIVTISNSAGFEGTASPGDETGEADISASFDNLEITFTIDVNQQ